MNDGTEITISVAVSFQIFCDTQEEIDDYWKRLTDGGQECQCGWLKDKFGLSWQIVPSILPKLMRDPMRAERTTKALLRMNKLDIKALEEV